MITARVVVEPSSISLDGTRPATGDITLLLGSESFPAVGWNDFIIVILTGWASALHRLALGTSQYERVYFMEGPYEVQLRRAGPETFALRALERPRWERALVEVDAIPLIESVVHGGTDVLAICRAAQHRSTDVERLEATVNSLRELTG